MVFATEKKPINYLIYQAFPIKGGSSTDYFCQKSAIYTTRTSSEESRVKSKKGKQIYLVILPDEKQANLKQLAEQLNEKRLSFLSEEQLLDLLGVAPGTVTPFALMHDQEKAIQVVIDSAIDQTSTVGFHPNVNTTTLILSFLDFIKILEYLEHPPIYEDL